MAATNRCLCHFLKTWALAVSLPLVLWPHTIFSQQYNFETLSLEEGLAQSQVFAICQDSKGYLWFGTYGGVSRYDGQRFTNFYSSDGLGNDLVASVAEDSSGNLWFGTIGGATMYDGSSFTTLTRADGLPVDAVRPVLCDRRGELWFGTRGGGVCRYDGDRLDTFTTDNGLSHNSVTTLFEDREGHIWIGTDDGVSKYDGASFSSLTTDDGLPAARVLSIAQDNEGTLWFGTWGGGVCYYDGVDVKPFDPTGDLARTRVFAILVDRDENLWFATEGGGVVRYTGTTVTRFTEKEGLASDRVYTIFQDREGLLWFGTGGGGVSKLCGLAFTYYTVRDGLASDRVWSILEDRKGNIWFATDGGGVTRFDGRTFAIFSEEHGLGSNLVVSMHEDQGGNLWFGHYGGGACRYNGRDFRCFGESDGLYGNGVWDIAEDDSGNLWFATYEAGAIRYDGRTFRQFTTDDGLAHNTLNGILVDTAGNVWFATDKGVTRYDGEQFATFREKDGLGDDVVMCAVQDANGDLWFGTYGGGISRFCPAVAEGKPFTETLTTADGLGDNVIMLLAADDEGHLWIGTNRGIDRFDVDAYKESGRKTFAHFGRDEGFRGIECNQNAVLQDRQGCLWFGTVRGAIKYDPSVDKTNQAEPVTHIAGLRLFFEDVDWTPYSRGMSRSNGLPTHLRLPYDMNHLTFDFIGLSLAIPSKVRYQYRLVGFDRDWTPVTTETRATYSNLPAREYVFQVKASNNDGVWNSVPTSFRFVIRPPFWRTWWFFVLCVLMAVGGFWGYVEVRTRRLERQRRRLEKMVETRTRQLQEEKGKTEFMNRELEQKNLELEKLSLVASETDNGVVITEADGTIEWVNAGFRRMTGYTLEELQLSRGPTLADMIPDPGFRDTLVRCMSELRAVSCEFRDVTKDDRDLWVSATLTPILDEEKRTKKLVMVITNITELKHTERALRESEERYSLAAKGANDGLWDWNLLTNEIYFGPRWKAMLGLDEEEIGYQPEAWFERVHPDDRNRLDNDLADHLEGRTPQFENEHRMVHADGSYRWMLSRGIAVRDEKGNAYRMVGSQSDVTERRVYDALTGLPNQLLFLVRVEHSLELARRRSDYLFSVLMIGIDQFRVVSDSLGPSAGDQLLIAAAHRLKKCLGETKMIGRLGDERFMVLLDDLRDAGDALHVAERIENELKAPVELAGQEVFTAASIGIALSTTGYQRPEDLIHDASTAMRRARTGGKTRREVFDTTMRTQLLARLELETALQGALARGELCLFYQPIISLKTCKITGFEALARWHHPERGLVLPDEFIPTAEETGLIIPLGRQWLRDACLQVQSWQRAFPSAQLTVNVNLSARQFSHVDLVKHVTDVLRETGLGPGRLRVEITESTIMENANLAADLLAQLRALEILLCIDDFGTGYSSLSYLQQFPIDALKIDKSFVDRIDEANGNIEIIRMIVALAHALGVEVIAEGVETSVQLDRLRDMGCESAQGNYFSPPVEPERARALLDKDPRW